MNTKLTLNINEEVIIQAKRYAQSKHRSVSKLVEDYLKVISNSDELLEISTPLIAPRVAELAQMFKGIQFPEGNYKDLIDETQDEKLARKS